jgi:hypothetical protein
MLEVSKTTPSPPLRGKTEKIYQPVISLKKSIKKSKFEILINQ